jgi:hypothetical protein
LVRTTIAPSPRWAIQPSKVPSRWLEHVARRRVVAVDARAAPALLLTEARPVLELPGRVGEAGRPGGITSPPTPTLSTVTFSVASWSVAPAARPVVSSRKIVVSPAAAASSSVACIPEVEIRPSASSAATALMDRSAPMKRA